MERTAAPLVMALVLMLAAVSSLTAESAALPGLASSIGISVNGTIFGTDKITQNGDLYTLTGDIDWSVHNGECLISIQKDNIVFDGSGHVIRGTGTGIAIELQGRRNVTVRNVIVENYGDGVDVTYGYSEDNGTITYMDSVGNLVMNNTFTTTYWGVCLRSTLNTTVLENQVNSLNNMYGIKVLSSRNNSLIRNRVNDGSINIEDSSQNLYTDNLVDGRLFAYMEDASDLTIEDAGQAWLVNCNNITVRNTGSSSDLRVTVALLGTNNSHVLQCSGRITLVNAHNNEVSGNKMPNLESNVYGSDSAISLSQCRACRLLDNDVSSANGYGIYLENCNSTVINRNRVSCNAGIAIEVVASRNSSISQNIVTSSACGIDLTYAPYGAGLSIPVSVNNIVNANNVLDCDQAISLRGVYNNTFFENNISNSRTVAVSIDSSDNNALYHNNFLNNHATAYEPHSFQSGMGVEYYYFKNNTWDDGYPSGGNYWSSYTGTDANEDGIGDTPFGVFENQTDHYPLMKPYTHRLLISLTPSPTSAPDSVDAAEQTPNQEELNSSTSPANPIQTATMLEPTAEPAESKEPQQPLELALYEVAAVAAVGVSLAAVVLYLLRPKPMPVA
jgi:parallel beta-helix repeat protein